MTVAPREPSRLTKVSERTGNSSLRYVPRLPARQSISQPPVSHFLIRAGLPKRFPRQACGARGGSNGSCGRLCDRGVAGGHSALPGLGATLAG